MCRSGLVLCPSGRVFSDECPWERTQRSAPPPPGHWAQAHGVLGWMPSGDGGCAGRWLVLCPSVRVFSDECPSERTQRSAPPPSCLWSRADGVLGGTPSGDGPCPIQVGSLPIGAGVLGGMPMGADTEVRAPATLLLAPCERCVRRDAQRNGAGWGRRPGSCARWPSDAGTACSVWPRRLFVAIHCDSLGGPADWGQADFRSGLRPRGTVILQN